MKHHTKNKGDIGVLSAQADLARQGFLILLPLTEHAPFDLVAYKKHAYYRVQVKYRSAHNGYVNIRFRSYWSDSKGLHEKQTDKSEIDLFCVYCPQTNECYYFDPKKYKHSFTLRVDSPKNNQKENIHFAKDFREVP